MAESKIPVVLLVTAQRDASFQAVIREAEAEIRKLGNAGASFGAATQASSTGATAGLHQVAQAAAQAERSVSRAAGAARELLREVQALGAGGGNALKALASSAGSAGGAIVRAAQQVNDLRRQGPATSAALTPGGAAGPRTAAGRLALNQAEALHGQLGLYTKVNRGMLDQVHTLNTALQKAQENFDQTARHAVEFGTAAGMSMLGAAAASGALLGYAVKTAGEFEQLRAKLETVQHSATKAAETFDFARELAAKTPFDVKGVVAAAVQLEVYGARAKEVLPLVADLAASMGRDIEATALVFGKALSGSLEGFESLRNEYGISSAKLAQFGAVLTKTGGISVSTAADLQKAQDALQKIVATKFGGAVERQSQTLQGALSNAGDSVQNLAAAFGDDLVPMVTLGARVFSSLLDAVAGIPGPIRVVGSVTAALGVGLLGLGGAAVLTTTALVALNAQMDGAKVGMSQLGAAATLTSGALNLFSGAVRRVSGFLAAMVTTPTGLFFTGMIAALAAANIAASAYEAQQKRTGERLAEESKALQNSVQTWRSYKKAIEEVTGKQISFGASVGDTAEEIREALKDSLPSEVVAKFQGKGVGLPQLTEDMKTAQGEADGLRQKVSELAAVLREMEASGSQKQRVGGGPLAAFFPEKGFFDFATIDEVRDRLKQLNSEFENSGKNRSVIQQLIDLFNGFAKPLDDSTEAAKKLDSYLKFAAKADDDVRSLTGALQVLQDGIDEMAGIGRKLKLPVDDVDALRNKLLTLPEGSERNWIEAYLEKLDQVPEFVDRINAANKKALDDRLALMDNEFAATQAGRDQDLAAEQKHLADKLAAVRKAREDSLRQMDAAFAKEHEGEQVSAAEKKAHEKAKADAVRGFRNEETKLLNEAHANQKSRQDKFVGDFRDRVQDAIRGVQELAASGEATAGEVTSGYESVLAFVDRWIKLNKDLIDQHPELKKVVDEIRDSVEKPTEASKKSDVDKRVADIKQRGQEKQAKATTPEEQLRAAQETRALYERALRSSELQGQQAADARRQVQLEILNLKRQERDLTEQIAGQERQIAQELGQLRLQALDQQIRGLELEGVEPFGARLDEDQRARARSELRAAQTAEEVAAIEQRLAAGLRAEEELVAARWERYRQELELLDMELQATLAAVGATEREKAAAHERYLIKKRMLDEAERQRVLQGLGREVDATRQAEKQKADARAQFERIGGSRSPLKTFEEAFRTGFRNPEFAFQDFGEGFGDPNYNPFKPQPAKPQQGEAALQDATTAAAEATRGFGEETTRAAEAVTSLQAPTVDLAGGAGNAATALVSLATAAASAATALSMLGGSGGGGGEKSELTAPKPEDMSYAPGSGPGGGTGTTGGSVTTRTQNADGTVTVGYGSRMVRMPTPADYGYTPPPQPHAARVAQTVQNVNTSASTNTVNFNGVKVDGPEAHAVAQAAQALIAKQAQRARMYRGPVH